MDATYTMCDDSWTNGHNDGWTREDIMAAANAFGVSVRFDELTGRVYEIVNGDDENDVCIGERD